MEKVNDLMDLHNKIKHYLDLEKYQELKEYLQFFIEDKDVSASEIKTILIITKSFKEDPILKETRKQLVHKIETMLDHKLK